MRAVVLVVLSLIAAAACVGDGLLKVRGMITDQAGRPEDGCRLELRMEKDEFLADWQDNVQSSFEQTFVVSPREKKLFFMIHCKKAAPYRSPIFVVRGSERYDDPIDLGQIRTTGE
jgi:hypothetical protein